MDLRRWLLAGAALCALAGIAALTVALCCVFELIGGLPSPCELWFLAPLAALPLGLGLGLIGRALGGYGALESDGCVEREET